MYKPHSTERVSDVLLAASTSCNLVYEPVLRTKASSWTVSLESDFSAWALNGGADVAPLLCPSAHTKRGTPSSYTGVLTARLD